MEGGSPPVGLNRPRGPPRTSLWGVSCPYFTGYQFDPTRSLSSPRRSARHASRARPRTLEQRQRRTPSPTRYGPRPGPARSNTSPYAKKMNEDAHVWVHILYDNSSLRTSSRASSILLREPPHARSKPQVVEVRTAHLAERGAPGVCQRGHLHEARRRASKRKCDAPRLTRPPRRWARATPVCSGRSTTRAARAERCAQTCAHVSTSRRSHRAPAPEASASGANWG